MSRRAACEGTTGSRPRATAGINRPRRTLTLKARWWDTLQWLWTNRDRLDEEARLNGLSTLAGLVQTNEQSAKLEIVNGAMFPEEVGSNDGGEPA